MVADRQERETLLRSCIVMIAEHLTLLVVTLLEDRYSLYPLCPELECLNGRMVAVSCRSSRSSYRKIDCLTKSPASLKTFLPKERTPIVESEKPPPRICLHKSAPDYLHYRCMKLISFQHPQVRCASHGWIRVPFLQ